MFTTRVLRQAAAHAERTPSIKFLGKRTVPASVDHTPQPHPESPSQSLPSTFTGSHSSFSKYRIQAQQFGPLRKTIFRATDSGYIGGHSGSALGPVEPAAGMAFDRNDLPERFRRAALSLAEIEAVESGGAAAFT